MFEDLIRDWDGELVATRFDQASATWMFIGVHSTALGPGFGGTRMKVYGEAGEGLRDVLRLSGAMTSKNAMADLPFGGGKGVLAVPGLPQGAEREALLERYAAFISTLGGSYVTACDMNTTERDMDVIARRCDHVMGTTAENGGGGSSAPDTAVGVFHGIRAGLLHATGSDDLAGRTVAVQGVGAVGALLAQDLSKAGAKVVAADAMPERARAVAERTGGEVVDLEDVFDVVCDVFSPCATGGVLNAETIPHLRCAVVAGAANNQLAQPEDADRLRAAGILYAPDYVVNAGGVLHLAGYERLGWSQPQMQERLEGIGRTLTQVFDAAQSAGITPEAAASQMVAERIAAASA
jgi:leucine dehydrogenase